MTASSGDTIDLAVTVAASPTDVNSFDISLPLVDEIAIASVSLARHDSFVEASAWAVDGSQIFGAHFQWTLYGANRISPLDSPGDYFYTDSSGDSEQDLCATIGSASDCMLLYPSAAAAIE